MPNRFYATEDIDLIDKFDIHKLAVRQKDPYMKGKPYMFMTTPKLNLCKENNSRDSYFEYMKTNYPKLMGSLTYDATSEFCTASPFIKLLSNNFIGLDGKDLAAKTTDVGETFYGYKQTLSGPYIDSIVGDMINVRYVDTKFLPVIQLHKLWMDYREHVGRGLMSPTQETINTGEYDFLSSLYYFVTDFDGSTILYYARYTGIVPVSNPYSALISNYREAHDIPDISVEYAYSYKEDMNPDILMSFNKLVKYSPNELTNVENSTKQVNIPIEGDIKTLIQPTSVEEHESFAKEWYRTIYSLPLIVKSKTNPNADSIDPKTKFKLIFM